MRRLVRKPFKGTFFYEWQVGPFVFQIRHNAPVPGLPGPRTHQPRATAWRDAYWSWRY